MGRATDRVGEEHHPERARPQRRDLDLHPLPQHREGIRVSAPAIPLLCLLASSGAARAQAPATPPPPPPELIPSSEAGDTAALSRDIGPLKDRIPPVTGHNFLMARRFELAPT